MRKIGIYAAMFFAGAFAMLAMVFFTQKPQTVINAENYIEEQKQQIGKIKQKGKGNQQTVKADQLLTKKEQRRENRAARNKSK